MASTLIDEARVALGGIGDLFSGVVSPTLRLGVTGLSRAGKTVFITALVHNLVAGGRLPLFAPMAEGRIARADLEPQPDDAIPRFAYEEHLAALTGDPTGDWPESTRRICQLRLTIEYQARRRWRTSWPRRLHARHRRLSRRMAARPAAARQELRATGRAETLAASRRRRALAAGRSLARATSRRSSRPRRADEAAARDGVAALHRLSAGGRARRRFALSTAAAGPLPDARRPRRLAGAHLRPLRRRRTTRRRAGIAARP